MNLKHTIWPNKERVWACVEVNVAVVCENQVQNHISIAGKEDDKRAIPNSQDRTKQENSTSITVWDTRMCYYEQMRWELKRDIRNINTKTNITCIWSMKTAAHIQYLITNTKPSHGRCLTNPKDRISCSMVVLDWLLYGFLQLIDTQNIFNVMVIY